MRFLAAAVVLVLTGCSLWSGPEAEPEDSGLLDWTVAQRAAARAGFTVRVPAGGYGLLNVTRVDRSAVSFDVVAPGGRLLTLAEARDRSSGLLRSLVADVVPLGVEQVGDETWRVVRQPSVGSLLLVHRYPDGVEVAVHGDGSLADLRRLVRSLGAPGGGGVPDRSAQRESS